MDSKILKNIRLKTYKSQTAFAKELGVSLSCICSWERGSRKPNITQQGRILDYCKLNNINIE